MKNATPTRRKNCPKNKDISVRMGFGLAQERQILRKSEICACGNSNKINSMQTIFWMFLLQEAWTFAVRHVISEGNPERIKPNSHSFLQSVG